MKFRDKDGNVLEDIEQALNAAFQCNECKGWADCSLGQEAIRGMSCREYVARCPVETARLMGYEVVEETPIDTPTKEVHMNDKPLRDWTLGDIKEHCKARKGYCVTGGNECLFYKEREDDKYIVCHLRNTAPAQWKLTDPRWTAEEVTVAKILYDAGIRELEASNALLPDSVYVKKDLPSAFRRCWHIPAVLFPSLKPGETVALRDIVGEGTNNG